VVEGRVPERLLAGLQLDQHSLAGRRRRRLGPGPADLRCSPEASLTQAVALSLEEAGGALVAVVIERLSVFAWDGLGQLSCLIGPGELLAHPVESRGGLGCHGPGCVHEHLRPPVRVADIPDARGILNPPLRQVGPRSVASVHLVELVLPRLFFKDLPGFNGLCR